MGRLDTWVAVTIRAYGRFDERLHEVLFSEVPLTTTVRVGLGTAFEPNPEAESLIDLLREGGARRRGRARSSSQMH